MKLIHKIIYIYLNTNFKKIILFKGVTKLNLLKYFKISKRESCPCGSGLKFMNCCYIKKINLKIQNKKPPEVLIRETMKKSMTKICLYPDQENCRGPIKKAHALQNNKIISLLAGDERHVYLLDAKRNPTIINYENGDQEVLVEITSVSANAATTETCFCDLHDNIAFAAIEKGAPDFNENDEEMKFIYAYKAFIFEYYKMSTSLEMFRTQFSINPKVFNNYKLINLYRNLQLNIREFEYTKKYFDNKITSKDYTGITSCIVKIPEQINFANYSYIAPSYDLNGKKIKNKSKGFIHRLSITVIPEKEFSYIVLSCLERDKHMYTNLFDQLTSSSLDKIKFYMSLFLPLYSENIVISPALWNTWDDEKRRTYTFYANLKNEQFFTFNKANGMILRNASKIRGFEYREKNIISLF